MTRSTRTIWITSLAMAMSCGAFAQKITSSPATDSSTQASPIRPTPKAATIDAATESSPEVGYVAKHSASIGSGTTIHAVLLRGIDSSNLKNGQHVQAKLSAPVKTSASTLPAGTPVVIEVVGTAPAGELTAVGEFSLQVDRVGSVETVTEIKTFRGEPGKREVADAAPAIGTNAGLAAGAEVAFQVAKPAVPATSAPKTAGTAPGSVDETASGSPGRQTGGSNSGEPTYGSDKSVLSH